MAAEILPEVTAAQQAERAAKEQERLERARALAVRAAPLGKQASMSESCGRVQKRAHMLPARDAIMGCAAPCWQRSALSKVLSCL
jgi:hypothetical protein